MPSIGFTGTRDGLTVPQSESLLLMLQQLRCTTFHHGDCVGADAEAHDIVRGIDSRICVVIHPPDKDKYRKFCKGDAECKPKSYLKRNEDIVLASDFMIGCPKTQEEQLRSGTWAAIRYARKSARRVHLIFPSGDVQMFNPELK